MTRDQPYDNLHTTRTVLDRLIRDHPTVTAHMNHGTPTHSSTHGGPVGAVELTQVEAAALRRIASQAGRYQLLIEHALVTLYQADSIRALAVTSHVDTAKAVTEDRCDGGAGEWADPTCERVALNDGNKPRAIWINGRQHQLCERCWNRQRQQEHRIRT